MKESDTRTPGSYSTNNEYQDDFECTDTSDGRTFWKKESPSLLNSTWHSYRPPSKLCAVLSVSILLLLTLIIALSVSNANVDRRLTSLEEKVVNISTVLKSITSKVHAGKDTDENIHSEIIKLKASIENIENQLISNENSNTQQINNLKISMENVKSQLVSAIKSLKAIDGLEPLKALVTELKCSIDKITNNVTTAGCCPVNWSFYSTSCYYFSNQGMSWDSAKEFCNAKYSSLVTLKDDREWDFVSGKTMPNFYWIGLTDERTGEWEWVDGTLYVMERRRWKPGQPDNWKDHGLGGGEDCAHLHNDGRLNDDHCSRSYRFVCKAPVVEKPE